MQFCEAFEKIKDGEAVRRIGWNDKYKFVVIENLARLLCYKYLFCDDFSTEYTLISSFYDKEFLIIEKSFKVNKEDMLADDWVSIPISNPFDNEFLYDKC